MTRTHDERRSRGLVADEGGFTLVEVLIAILITGILFTGFFSIIRTGINTQIMVREFADSERIGPAILNQVSEDLRNAYFYNVDGNDFFVGKSVELGSGTRIDQIHFLTTRSSLVSDPLIDESSDALQPGSPVTEVSYMLREAAEAGFYELVRREQPLVDDDRYRGGYLRLISDRILSFKIQYTGWDFGVEGANPAGEVLGGAAGDPGTEDPAASGSPASPFASDEDETAELLWEDDWRAVDKGALPVAVKIELVVSPDVDPEVMQRMRYDDRLGELDKSYVHIVLLPQFREDPEVSRLTSAWDGTIAEPQIVNQGGVAGGAARGEAGGARGDARGGAAGGARRGGNPGGGTNVFQGGGNRNQGGNNRLAEILRGGGGGGNR